MSLPGIEQVAFSKIKGITPETAGAIFMGHRTKRI